MAIVSLTPISVPFNTATVGTLTASTTDGLEYAPTRVGTYKNKTMKDENTLLVVYNSSADTAYDITIKAPTNKVATSAAADVVVEVAFGKTAYIPLESAMWKDHTTGKITFDSENAALKADVIVIG